MCRIWRRRTAPFEWRTKKSFRLQRSPRVRRSAENLRPLSPCPASLPTERIVQISTSLSPLIRTTIAKNYSTVPRCQARQYRLHITDLTVEFTCCHYMILCCFKQRSDAINYHSAAGFQEFLDG